MTIARERPICRKEIIAKVLCPHPGLDNWDGETALDQGGNIVVLTAGLRTQMRTMMREGYWGQTCSATRIPKETGEQRKCRLQQFCDSITILDNARPVAVNSGDKLLRVEHTWPLARYWDYEFSYVFMEDVPIKKPPFHHVPAWVFEEDNPVSVTARMTFAFPRLSDKRITRFASPSGVMQWQLFG